MPGTGQPLSAQTLAELRSQATTAARAAGLSEDRTGRFILAVDEAMTNAIRYARGGLVSITVDSGVQLTVEIRDRGPGIPPGTNQRMPPPEAVSGRGLALMHALCDRVVIDTGPDGTLVCLTMLLPEPARR